MSGLGSLQAPESQQSPAIPIHEYARDSKGRYDKEVLMKLLAKRSGMKDEEIDFIFEYLMVGD